MLQTKTIKQSVPHIHITRRCRSVGGTFISRYSNVVKVEVVIMGWLVAKWPISSLCIEWSHTRFLCGAKRAKSSWTHWWARRRLRCVFVWLKISLLYLCGWHISARRSRLRIACCVFGYAEAEMDLCGCCCCCQCMFFYDCGFFAKWVFGSATTTTR